METMTFFGKSILFLGAHPDDIELGCGAFIAEISGKANLYCMTFSDNQKNPELQHLVPEHQHSMQVLGLAEGQVELGAFETRRFPDARQEILEKMLELRRRLHPEVVFVHTPQDIHQDHITVTQEALRAFRGTTVLGFDVLRSSYGFFPHFLVEVSPESLEKKIAALEQYTTYANRYYFSPEVIRSTAIRHGALAERPYAEGFDIIRIVAKFTQP
jgi:LmbE family N-acetylglucosaminyl deacetylase